MFKHLRIIEHKGLVEAELRHLGKINIICGKNNSGKSTILECISELDRRKPGKELSSADGESIAKDSFRELGLSPAQQKEQQEYCKLISKNILEREIWFTNDVNDFLREVKTSLESHSRLKGRPFPEGLLQTLFLNKFLPDPTVLLLPPHRNLEPIQLIDVRRIPEPHGIGILNNLFHYGTQTPTSDKKDVFDRIGEAFQYISNGYQFHISQNEANQAEIQFAFKDAAFYRAEDCGLGLQDLLVILWFAFDESVEVLLIEEPESHMHPEMQRRLITFMKDETDKQYFITTHSNVYLNSTFADRVFFTRYDGRIKVEDTTSKARILSDIGYDITDNLLADVIILVEGSTDKPVVEEMLRKLGIFGKYSISIWCLGGDLMVHQDIKVFSERNNVFALIDREAGTSSVKREAFKEKCTELGIPCLKTARYSIENYYSLPVLKTIFGSQVPDNFKEIDHDIKLQDQLNGLNVKSKAREIVREMTLDDWKGTDVIDFFSEIKNYCEEA